MDISLIVLRLVHVLCGVFWAGTAFFMVSFVEPTVRKLGPAGGPFMTALNTKTRYMIAMPVMGLLTILSGTVLFMQLSGGNHAFARSAMGLSLSIGALTSLIALVLGFAVMAPNSKKMIALAQAIQAGGGAPSPEQLAEMAPLQKKLGMGGRSIATLLGVAVVTMAIARYLV